MTKSTGVGRGGSRPGAGRKKKADPAPKERRSLPETSASVEDVEALARSYTELAVKALAEIALNGEKEAARVAAANAILDRGYGKPAAANAVPQGKKEQQQASAERAAKGRFAPAAPPKLVVNNGA